MTETRKQDPLHGITLKAMVTQLEAKYGWEELSSRIKIQRSTMNQAKRNVAKWQNS